MSRTEYPCYKIYFLPIQAGQLSYFSYYCSCAVNNQLSSRAGTRRVFASFHHPSPAPESHPHYLPRRWPPYQLPPGDALIGGAQTPASVLLFEGEKTSTPSHLLESKTRTSTCARCPPGLLLKSSWRCQQVLQNIFTVDELRFKEIRKMMLPTLMFFLFVHGRGTIFKQNGFDGRCLVAK